MIMILTFLSIQFSYTGYNYVFIGQVENIVDPDQMASSEAI